MSEAEDRRAVEKLWDKHQIARVTYNSAKWEALDKVEESLEPLRTASEDTLAAYKEALAVLMEYTTPHPRPGEPL